jgi:hypothetical protein
MTSLTPRPDDDKKKRQRAETDDWFARAAKKSVAKLVDSPVVDLFLRAADAKKKKADDERLMMRGVMRPY